MAQVKTDERPVLAAIRDVTANVGAIKKNGWNDFHKYKYATASDLADALQHLLSETGLVVIPHQRSMEVMAEGALLAIEFEFLVSHVSGDTLDQRPVFTGISGLRNSKGGVDDKAANKCLTTAMKYFCLHMFKIPTVDYDDPDKDASPPAPPTTEPKPAKRQQAPAAAKPADTKPVPNKQQLAEWVERQIRTVLPNLVEKRGEEGLSEWSAEYSAKIEEGLRPQAPELADKLMSAFDEHWQFCVYRREQREGADGDPDRDSAADMFP